MLNIVLLNAQSKIRLIISTTIKENDWLTHDQSKSQFDFKILNFVISSSVLIRIKDYNINTFTFKKLE